MKMAQPLILNIYYILTIALICNKNNGLKLQIKRDFGLFLNLLTSLLTVYLLKDSKRAPTP